jgi:hypothetical protein
MISTRLNTGTTAMAIVPLPIPPGAEARALLHHLLEHGHIAGRGSAGGTIIQLEVDDWVLETLMTFDAEAADLEDGGDDEPDADDEENGLPVAVDLVRPKVVERRRASLQPATDPWHQSDDPAQIGSGPGSLASAVA